MAFAQLYYTSCQVGISGHAGYQFNATTPGLPREVLDEVEVLTAYQPPGGDGELTPAAEMPVNLCFVPGAQTIIANVVSAGTDFSGRSGNYFAHALVTSARHDDLAGRLPIELWQAPLWRQTPVEQRELPEVSAPLAAGPLNRATVARFLQRHPHSARLSALVSAVLTDEGERHSPILLVERNTADTANWIAAVSYLLPPAQAAVLSFSTYHHRPQHARVRMIGLVPRMGIDIASAPSEGFLLFDFHDAQFSEVEVTPLAALLCRVGVEDAASLWDRAVALEDADDADVRHAVVAAVAVDRGSVLQRADVDAVMNWLPGAAERLERSTVEQLGDALSQQEAFADEHVRPLADAARRAFSIRLLEHCERRIVELDLGRLAAGGPVGEPARLADETARAAAADGCLRLLAEADAPRAATILTWAAEAEVELDAGLLQDWGAQILGPALIAAPADERLGSVLVSQPHAERGALLHLNDLARTAPDQILELLGHGLVYKLNETRVRHHPHLFELFLIAGSTPDRRVHTLVRLMQLRPATADAGGIDLTPSLGRLWPAGIWSLSEARQVLSALGGQGRFPDVARPWIVAALEAAGVVDEPYLALCRDLRTHNLEELLPVALRAQVEAVLRAEAMLHSAGHGNEAEAVHATMALLHGLDSLPEVARPWVRDHLAPALSRVPADLLPEVLFFAPRTLLERFLVDGGKRLEHGGGDLPLAAALFKTVLGLRRKGDARAALVEDVLRTKLSNWRRRTRESIGSELTSSEQQAFDDWLERRSRGWAMDRVTRGLRRRPDSG